MGRNSAVTFLNVLFTKTINYYENKSQVKKKSYSCATDTSGEEVTTFLTFLCPCIASMSLKYNQQYATFSRSI